VFSPAVLIAIFALAIVGERAEFFHFGLGASVEQLLGTTAKFIIGCVIWLTITVALRICRVKTCKKRRF